MPTHRALLGCASNRASLFRTHARCFSMATVAELTALQALTFTAITALTTGGASSYSINGRAVTKLDLDKLWSSYNQLGTQIAAANSASRGNSSLVSFGRPCS